MPLTAGATANSNFSVNFCGREYTVDCVLQKRPISVVLAVSRGSRRRVVKIVSSHCQARRFSQTDYHFLCSFQNARSAVFIRVALLVNDVHTRHSDHPTARLCPHFSEAPHRSLCHILTIFPSMIDFLGSRTLL
jgi:hypothetical protein